MVGLVDLAKVVHTGDECSDKAQVDEGNEKGGAPGRAQSNESCQSPGRSKNGNDEENKDGRRREQIVVIVAINEPCLRFVN
jgi:hypothetical protein